VSVRTEDGRAFLVPRELLTGPRLGAYSLPLGFAELAGPQQPGTGKVAAEQRPGEGSGSTARSAGPSDKPLVVPVLAERLVVTKRPVVTGRLRITKRVHSRQAPVEETVQVERAEVERVPINRVVEAAPPIRHEGDTMVISVVEEVIVVEKRLMLREEIRISKRRLEQRISESVTIRSEDVIVDRLDSKGRKRHGERE
jgi:uncharacterized protein (TIGR02271 family)